MIKKRRFFKKKKKSKKQREFNKFFSYKNFERKDRNFMYKDFSNSKSIHSHFTRSCFDYAKFYKAHMKYCGFNGCSFNWIEFKSCNFRGSRFKGAIFKNVVFNSCILTNSSFEGAIFENVYFLHSGNKNIKGINKLLNKIEDEKLYNKDDIEELNKILNNHNIKLKDLSLVRLLKAFSKDQINEALSHKKPVKNEINYVAKIVSDYIK